jgi:hypothetical protein
MRTYTFAPRNVGITCAFHSLITVTQARDLGAMEGRVEAYSFQLVLDSLTPCWPISKWPQFCAHGVPFTFLQYPRAPFASIVP